MAEARETWLITVADAGDENGVPFDVRVRRWLKSGLRGFRVRVVTAGDRNPLLAEVERLRREIEALTPREG